MHQLHISQCTQTCISHTEILDQVAASNLKEEIDYDSNCDESAYDTGKASVFTYITIFREQQMKVKIVSKINMR